MVDLLGFIDDGIEAVWAALDDGASRLPAALIVSRGFPSHCTPDLYDLADSDGRDMNISAVATRRIVLVPAPERRSALPCYGLTRREAPDVVAVEPDAGIS